jgi:UDP-N-acetylglucosamine 2-epimerase
VRVALVGDERPTVRAALEAEGEVELVEPPEALAASRDGQIAELAAALRALERLFGDERVERVVLAGSSNVSLAAVLVATKMLIPVGALQDANRAEAGEGPSALNARLIEHLADAALAEDAGVVAAWLREPQQRSQSKAEH